MKKLLSLLLALVMLLSFAACANDDTPPADGDDQQQEEQNGSESTTMNKLADIKAAGELVVGTSADYPPYEFHTEIDGKDTIVGFDIAIAQAFADELGVELKLVDMAFESLLISLQKGDFDLVMAGLTPDEKRAKTVDFTDVFFHNKQIVIIRAEDADKYVTTEDMAGTTLGVQAGTVQETIAADLTDENKVVKLKKFPELIMELKTGKLTASAPTPWWLRPMSPPIPTCCARTSASCGITPALPAPSRRATTVSLWRSSTKPLPSCRKTAASTDSLPKRSSWPTPPARMPILKLPDCS